MSAPAETWEAVARRVAYLFLVFDALLAVISFVEGQAPSVFLIVSVACFITVLWLLRESAES